MTRHSAQLENEVEQARRDLTGTLDELRSRLTPGQVVDQVADYVREGPASDFIRNLTEEIRENPIPLLMVAAGMAWLAVASSHRSQAKAICEATTGEITTAVAPTVQSDPFATERVPDQMIDLFEPV
jgi:hypothetical protein